MPTSPRRADPAAESACTRYLRTGRQPAPVEYKYNHNHSPINGQFIAADDVARRMTPEARAVADKIGREFYLRTGKRITINSGTRSPASQAEAMLGKHKDWAIYKDQRAVGEIRAALQRSEAAGATHNQKVSAMAAVIQQQVDRGLYISDHLRSHALDIHDDGLLDKEKKLLRDLGNRYGKHAIIEMVPPHVHVKY